MSFFHSKLIKFLLLGLLFELVIFSLFRVSFLVCFSNEADQYSSSQLLYPFWVGFRFDLQLAIIIYLPILFLSGFKYIGIFKSAFGQHLWLGYLLVVNIVIFSLYITNLFYYDFFKRLIDSSIIRYLYDFKDAFTMVLEGYPIIQITLGILAFVVLAYWLFNKLYQLADAKEESFPTRKGKWLVYSLFTVLFIFAGYGKFEMYPWRWSEAFYSSDKYLSYLASNPVTYFQNTLKNKGEKYNRNATTEYYDEMADFLGLTGKERNKEKLNFTRLVTPNHSSEYSFDKPNIVFILGESTSYARSSLSKNPLNPTPFLKHMSDNGLTYTRYYTPHSGTARGVWATLTGLADVEHTRTSSRNPMVVNQKMIINSLSDYKKFYFIGGSLSWGNVRGVVSNISDIKKFEEQHYPNSPHNDVWGISDMHLVGEVNDILKVQKEPFFAYVQLASNHSPNTFPDERFGFKTSQELGKTYTEDELFKYSFKGETIELDGQRYLDHSVKRLIELAKKEAYFDNTIYIFVGDHGVSNRGDHMHDAEQVFETATLHTPLIIYAPKLIKHKVVEYPVSAVDIMATIAGLSGQQYINSTMGRDILEQGFDQQPHFIFYKEHGGYNPLLSVMSTDYVARVKADGSKQQLYKYYFKEGDKDKNLVVNEGGNQKSMHAKKVKKMTRLARGIYETTRYIRYNNYPKYIENIIKELGLSNGLNQ